MKTILIILIILFTSTVYAGEGKLKGVIAYSRLTDGYWQIWAKDLSTNSEQQLTSSNMDKKNPVWSPDGNRLIYRTSNGEIYIIDRNGLNEKRLLLKLGYLVDPHWLPDMNGLIFVRFRSDLKDDSEIMTAAHDGSELRVLNDEPGVQYNPDVSSDGKRVAYVSVQKPEEHEIWVMDIKGKDRKKMTANSSYNIDPEWSPDGEQIVFASNRSGNYEIWLMKSDGSSQVKITDIRGYSVSPVWSSDGNNIAFASNKDGMLEIWTMDRSGKNLNKVTGGAQCVDPSWQ